VEQGTNLAPLKVSVVSRSEQFLRPRSGHSVQPTGAVFGGAGGLRVSSYDYFVASEGQIQKWADEAEVGYNFAELKRRGRGRPGRGAEPMQVVAVRLTAEELGVLDAAAERRGLSRSEAIREALAHYAA
jgi:hypothetical protein